MSYQVSLHALRRWRERFAAYGDSNAHELFEVFQQSNIFDGDLPFARVRGKRYHYHAKLGCFCVVDIASKTIVTVLGK